MDYNGTVQHLGDLKNNAQLHQKDKITMKNKGKNYDYIKLIKLLSLTTKESAILPVHKFDSFIVKS